MKNALLAAAGVVIVAAHAIAFRAFATTSDASDFLVDVSGPLASPTNSLTLDAKLPDAIRRRITTTTEGTSPGLQRRRWSIDYRGGFSRSAYAAQLVGPYQDPDKLACSGRVTVAQNLLDDGKASEGTLAAEIKKEVTRELAGTEVWPAGPFTRVEHISVKWARLELHPDDWAMIGVAPLGYVQVSLRIGFQRVSVPMVLALIPNDPPTAKATGASTNDVGSTKAPELTFRIVSRADFSFDNRVLQFLDDKLGGSKLATKLAREQIDGLIMTALAPPPPFALDDQPDGQTLQFTFCDQPTEVADNKWGALPFAVVIGRVHAAATHEGSSTNDSISTDRSTSSDRSTSADRSTSNDLGSRTILPPKNGPAPHTDIAANAQLALDLDLDALNAILYELWRGGFLDKKLAEAGLDKQFNADPTVQALLSIRVSPPRLALPPVLTVAPGNSPMNTTSPTVLRLLADSRVMIADGAADDVHRSTTVGRVWGGVDFTFDQRGASGKPDGPSVAASIVHLDELDLACERGPTTANHATIAPCYSDLVATMRGRSGEFDGALTAAFAKLLSDVFVERRLGATGLPADLVIKSAAANAAATGENASLHLDLHAALQPAQ